MQASGIASHFLFRMAQSLFIFDTGSAPLNVYQLSFVRFWPVFSLSYTVSLPFLIFCCQFVAREHTPRICLRSLIYHRNAHRIK